MSNPYLEEASGYFGYGETMGDDDDDLGDDDLGDDDLGAFQGDDELAGRGMLAIRRRRRVKRRAKRGRALGRGLTAQAKIELARGDDIIFGVDSGATLVGVGATATITTSPQKRGIPQKMYLSAAVATAFLINDIRVGVEPVLATNAAISAAIFIQDSTAATFRAVICEVGMDFSVTVTNISLAAARFTSTVTSTWLPANL